MEVDPEDLAVAGLEFEFTDQAFDAMLEGFGELDDMIFAEEWGAAPGVDVPLVEFPSSSVSASDPSQHTWPRRESHSISSAASHPPAHAPAVLQPSFQQYQPPLPDVLLAPAAATAHAAVPSPPGPPPQHPYTVQTPSSSVGDDTRGSGVRTRVSSESHSGDASSLARVDPWATLPAGSGVALPVGAPALPLPPGPLGPPAPGGHYAGGAPGWQGTWPQQPAAQQLLPPEQVPLLPLQPAAAGRPGWAVTTGWAGGPDGAASGGMSIQGWGGSGATPAGPGDLPALAAGAPGGGAWVVGAGAGGQGAGLAALPALQAPAQQAPAGLLPGGHTAPLDPPAAAAAAAAPAPLPPAPSPPPPPASTAALIKSEPAASAPAPGPAPAAATSPAAAAAGPKPRDYLGYSHGSSYTPSSLVAELAAEAGVDWTGNEAGWLASSAVRKGAGGVAAGGAGGAGGAAALAPGQPRPGEQGAADVAGSVSAAATAAAMTGAAAAGQQPAPAPQTQGPRVEELLAGLDLQEVFSPPKSSHAKRIRGHVRRNAELKYALADRVRAIQTLAAENQQLRNRARVLDLLVAARNQQLGMLAAFRATPDEKAYIVPHHPHPHHPQHPQHPQPPPPQQQPQAGVWPGGGASPLPPGVTPAALSSMPVSGLLEVLRRMVADLSVTLMAVEGEGEGGPGGGAGALQQLQQQQALLGGQGGLGAGGPPGGASARALLRSQVWVFRTVLRYVGLVNEETCRLADTTLQGEVQPASPEHWMRVARGLGLGEQQLADAAGLAGCCEEWLARIRSERRSLSLALSQLLTVPKYGNAYGETAAHVHQYGTDAAAIAKMQANVMREKILLVLAAEVFCSHILTEVQWARAIVQSYPHVCDVWELLRAAALLHAATARGLPAPAP